MFSFYFLAYVNVYYVFKKCVEQRMRGSGEKKERRKEGRNEGASMSMEI